VDRHAVRDEERGGDLRAVTGTEAELEVSTDRPLQGGQIQLDNGQKIQLTGGQNNVYRGTVKMDQDGVYHVAGVEAGQPVRVSEDFFIEARKANPAADCAWCVPAGATTTPAPSKR
jgi:hypothetical protein